MSEFRLIPPITITDALLTSSTIPETVAATYSGATTYAEDDRAGPAPVDGSPQTVWRSLQSGNTGNAQTEGVWWTAVGVVYPAYNAGVTYADGDIVTDTTNHLLYESLVGSNLGNALTDATKWESLGATNRWKMFDAKYGTQSTNENEMVIVLAPGQIVNSIALLNLEGESVTVEQSVSGYSETINLSSHEVMNWYDFYYDLPIRTGDVVLTDIPPYPASTLTITITNDGDTAKCGMMAVGKYRGIGTTQWEAVRSINDYSRADQDADGNVTLTQGNYSKRLSLNVHVPSEFESEAARLLELYRATPLVFVGSEDYETMIIYGFLGAWNIPISDSGRLASIEIKGLI